MLKMKVHIEHACLGLAIVNAIVTGLTLVGSIILVFFFVFNMQQDHIGADEARIMKMLDLDRTTFEALAGTIIAVIVLAAFISFVFAVLLCNGICNRRPGQVQAYFIYGVITTIMAANATAGLLFDGRNRHHLRDVGIQGLLGCVSHSLFLVLVYRTYVKLRKDAMFNNHVRLDEKVEKF